MAQNPRPPVPKPDFVGDTIFTTSRQDPNPNLASLYVNQMQRFRPLQPHQSASWLFRSAARSLRHGIWPQDIVRVITMEFSFVFNRFEDEYDRELLLIQLALNDATSTPQVHTYIGAISTPTLSDELRRSLHTWAFDAYAIRHSEFHRTPQPSA